MTSNRIAVKAMRATCTCISAVMLRAGSVVCATCGAPVTVDATTTGSFSQHDGSRPPGCGRVRYLRIWRSAFRAGDAGATRDGRARLLTHDAYQRFARIERAVESSPRPVEDEANDVLSELGAVRRSA